LDCSFLAPDSALAPVFRVVAADRYRREFASDRSHMREDDGSYRQPPPSWPAIGGVGNLARFVDMDDRFVGEVMDLTELRAWLGR
jgi:protein N-terminal glutamine amidohydrolase